MDRRALLRAGAAASLAGAGAFGAMSLAGRIPSAHALTTTWNTLSTPRPVVTVTPNGPTDGGDYGPNTASTTTGGIQEALNNALTVRTLKGSYSITASQVTMNALNSLEMEQGVQFPITGSYVGLNLKINNISSHFGIIGAVPVPTEYDSADSDLTTLINALEIDSTTASVDSVYVQGVEIPTVTVNSGSGSNSYGVGLLWFYQCWLQKISITNSGNTDESPTSLKIKDSFLDLANNNTPFLSGDAIGQTLLDGNVILWETGVNNAPLVQVSGLSTMVDILNSDIVMDVSGLTGNAILQVGDSSNDIGDIYHCAIDNAYIEDLSPLYIMTCPSSSGFAGSYNISRIDYNGEVNESIFNLQYGLDTTYLGNTKLILRDIGFANTGSNTLSMGIYQTSMFGSGFTGFGENIQDVSYQGIGLSQPSFPSSGSYYTNTNFFTVRIYITSHGSATISSYTLKDTKGNTYTFSLSPPLGTMFIFEPGAAIKFAYTGSPIPQWGVYGC